MKVISKSLKVILCFTGSQCSLNRMQVMCSLILDLVTSLAAEFCKHCNLLISFAGSLYSKLFLEIADYGLHFDLLQWQYDRALYKVVSGAINTARFSNCSPARALDSKPFSVAYWQWQHRYHLDAVEQFGLPHVFLTISPIALMRVFPKAIVLTTKSHFHVKRTHASIRGLVVRTITSGKTRISAIEWSFPFAKWLSHIRQCTGMAPMELPGYET